MWAAVYSKYALSHDEVDIEKLEEIGNGLHSDVFFARITRKDNTKEMIHCVTKVYRSFEGAHEVFINEVINQINCHSPTTLPIISYIYDKSDKSAPIILLPFGTPLNKFIEQNPNIPFGIISNSLFISFLTNGISF